MRAEIELPDGPPWPAALAGGAGAAGRAQSGAVVLAIEHGALVADVHAWFLVHGLAASDPTQPAARPRDRGLWYCPLIEPNAWGASQIRASFWEPCRERAPSGHDGLGSALP
jgi:hypothetical protein